jgi:hypothetical protein
VGERGGTPYTRFTTPGIEVGPDERTREERVRDEMFSTPIRRVGAVGGLGGIGEVPRAGWSTAPMVDVNPPLATPFVAGDWGECLR